GLAEVEQLQEAIKIQCENFIKEHLLREILQNSGHELEALLTMLSIYRRPVLKEGIQAMAEKAGLLEWEQLTAKGMSLSLIEYHHIHKAYGVLPLFLGKLQAKREDILFYHEIAYGYYKKICTAKDTIEPVVMEEWIYHALGCGQGKIVSEQGARLVWYLRESFAFREAQRVSEWILAEKSKDFTNEEDAILLNEIALTFKTMCHYDKAVELYQKALGIDRALFGKTHFTVARDLNNLGVVIRMQLGPAEALKYFEQALRIVESEGFASQNLEMAGNIFNNMGSIRHGMLDYDKAEELYHKALRSWESVYDKRHPNIATLYNNLGAICSRLNKYEEAANYFNLALSIDQSIYGKMHFEVATDLNNLGMVFAGTGDHNQAIDYYEQALTIWQHVYGSCHPNFAVTLNNMADAYLALNQKEKASVYFKNVYPIFKEKFGPNHTHTIDIYNKIKMIAAGS
ncbi:MAG: tetratricopeptide repeat protein, partial [Acidobacteria bacterium]|nr:tetratricopeptide repeat protein [Acidobacteriota bacterium]